MILPLSAKTTLMIPAVCSGRRSYVEALPDEKTAPKCATKIIIEKFSMRVKQEISCVCPIRIWASHYEVRRALAARNDHRSWRLPVLSSEGQNPS
jgi:hypothetical protein